MNTVPAPSPATEEMIYVRTEYAAMLLGEPTAAAMLSQIVYWYLPTKQGKPKLQVRRGGCWWIAKSYPEWQEELHLTYEQARRSLRVLKRLGLVETMVAKFAGVPKVHVRLKVAGGAAMLKNPPTASQLREDVPVQHSSICVMTQVHVCSSTGPSVFQHRSFTETTAENTTEIKEEATPLASPCEQEEEKAETKTAEEELKPLKEAKEENSIGATANKTPVQHWRDLQLNSGVTWLGPLSMQDLGMLKTFGKFAGDKAFAALDYAFANWWKFVQKVNTEHGEKHSMEKPQLWMIVKYRQTLVNMLVQSIAAAKKAPRPALTLAATTPPQPAHLTASGPVEAEAPYIPTLADAEAYWNAVFERKCEPSAPNAKELPLTTIQ